MKPNEKIKGVTGSNIAADRPTGREGAAGPEAAPRGLVAAAALLESLGNRVTGDKGADVGIYEVVKCPCDCWFCAECCRRNGYRLRWRLIPVLGTFGGLMMLTFTVDPLLFPTPDASYRYMMERRCIARTIQDMHRQGFLLSRRYFCVVEWQKRTEQAHFHVLVDATFIPWDALLASWSKHRPAWAGPVVGDRPAFGTVLFSKRHFEGGAEHAARYATKYLIKVPAQGFPAWVLGLGKTRRVRRYSTSRGFWNEPAKVSPWSGRKRGRSQLTYADRIKKCGTTANVFKIVEKTDQSTGERYPARKWVSHIWASQEAVIDGLTKRQDCVGSVGEFVAIGNLQEGGGHGQS